MIRDAGSEPLWRWLNSDMSPAAASELAAHPKFTEAARALYKVKVEQSAYPVMAALSRDAGHYVAAALAFSLHRDGGITLSRLKAACAETRLMSPGRALSMLGYLLHVGVLSKVSEREGRKPAVYAPTQSFNLAWCGRMRHGLEAAALLEPAAWTVVHLMDDPVFAIAFAQRRGEAMLAGLASAVGHDLPFVRIFNHRLGGGRALALLLSRDAGEGAFAMASVPWAPAEIIQHCGISRMQAKRLFDDALSEGLVTIEGDRLTWTAVSRQFILYSCAFELIGLLCTAAAMLAEFSGKIWTRETSV